MVMDENQERLMNTIFEPRKPWVNHVVLFIIGLIIGFVSIVFFSIWFLAGFIIGLSVVSVINHLLRNLR